MMKKISVQLMSLRVVLRMKAFRSNRCNGNVVCKEPVEMNIAEYSIRNKVISWLFVLLLLVEGFLSFNGMIQLEFPEFTMKQAMVIINRK